MSDDTEDYFEDSGKDLSSGEDIFGDEKDDSEDQVANQDSSVDNYNEDYSNDDDDDLDEDDGGEKQPFYKTQNGILFIAGSLAFVLYGAYIFMNPQHGNQVIQSPVNAPVAKIAVNVPQPVLEPVSAVNDGVKEKNTQIENNKVTSEDNNMSFNIDDKIENSMKENVKNPCGSLLPKDAGVVTKVVEKAKDAPMALKEKEIKKLQEDITLLNEKVDNLVNSLGMSYQLISDSIASLKDEQSKNATKEALDKIVKDVVGIKSSLSSHRKNVYKEMKKIQHTFNNGKVSYSKRHSSASKKNVVVKNNKRTLVKGIRLTSVVNGTAWIKNKSGKNFRLSVGDIYDKRASVKKIYADSVVLSDGRFISK